eukprot:TRINITY_DN13266_c0_g1_i1.p1 TRINITY_DN13266_c0_g1~~TRINITY_DN13266_c0_g1_i1.p1  ORF type:complete len:153 (+),score=30.27 TRINITY_DN13266_c0_g1_i1:100-558(+)
MAGIFTEEEFAAFKKAFERYDKNGKGVIYTKDLDSMLQSVGYNASAVELQDMINMVDPDGVGTIDFANFLSIAPRYLGRDKDPGQELTEAFQMFDKDSTGLVSKDVVQHVLKNIGGQLTNEEIGEVIREADVESNGNVNYEEFIRFLIAKEA